MILALSPKLKRELEELAEQRETMQTVIVREALLRYLEEERQTKSAAANTAQTSNQWC
jgi:predicted transcriptional regulator